MRKNLTIMRLKKDWVMALVLGVIPAHHVSAQDCHPKDLKRLRTIVKTHASDSKEEKIKKALQKARDKRKENAQHRHNR